MTYTKKELTEILKDNTVNEELFRLADRTRKEYVGDAIHLRALIEFSNVCGRTCKYCGLRSANSSIERYRIPFEEIVKCSRNACELGYKTVVLQSGEDSYYSTDMLCRLIEEIKKQDIALTLSIGERPREDYKAFKESGADRYLLRIETTDRNLYKKMHPHMDFENRLRCLHDLKELGYETGTGCLVGLPGQSIESLAEDILFFQKFNADMIGIGPFLSHPKTPLKNEPNGNFNLALKVTALTRIILKNINIPATTAMETLNKNGRIIALKSGANVIMPNLTNPDYCSKYEIYPDKANLNENSFQNLKYIEEKIQSIGRYIAQDKGFRRT